jgi:hypothetical protein
MNSSAARALLSRIVFLLAASAAGAHAANLTCSSSTTLDALATCIRQQMPASGSNGFVVPTASQQADYRWVARQMLGGSCSFSLPASLGGIMQLRAFTDSSKGKAYCLFMEVQDANSNGKVDHGWGTFIVNAQAQRELSHQAPHPISDSTTEVEAVLTFRDTNSRSYLMCGAHRDANTVVSTCQPEYNQADCAHNIDNMFHAVNQELKDFYAGQSWNAIQWHGMAESTCPNTNAYFSHGRNVVPAAGDKIVALRNNMLTYHPSWLIDTPGTGACSLNATDNVQGRLLNEVFSGSVCGTAASLYTGKFIHNEQDPLFRTAADWVPALQDTWTVGPSTPPAAPTALAATGAKKKINLTWNASPGATSYSVKRSTVSGGPYTIIVTGVTSTSFTNNGLQTGATYFYVVTASNVIGESGPSNQASAKVK